MLGKDEPILAVITEQRRAPDLLTDTVCLRCAAEEATTLCIAYGRTDLIAVLDNQTSTVIIKPNPLVGLAPPPPSPYLSKEEKEEELRRYVPTPRPSPDTSTCTSSSCTSSSVTDSDSGTIEEDSLPPFPAIYLERPEDLSPYPLADLSDLFQTHDDGLSTTTILLGSSTDSIRVEDNGGAKRVLPSVPISRSDEEVE